MTSKKLAAAIGLFGSAVIASGVIRMMVDSNGQNGLYFGLVMGGIALIGALLTWFNLVLAGRIVAAFAAAVVLLWFGYDMYGDLSRGNPFGGAEIRKSILIALGAALSVCLCLPIRLK